MADRLYLQAQFEKILGSRNVYFQPPASVSMKYPAIVYKPKDFRMRSANNTNGYTQSDGYEGVLITREPDPKCLGELLKLPYCRFDRPYTSNNLHHFAFTIYL